MRDCSPDAGGQVKAVVLATHVLSSASTWSHLRDYCGLDGAEGGKIAAEAIELIVEATKARAKVATAADRPAPGFCGFSHSVIDSSPVDKLSAVTS